MENREPSEKIDAKVKNKLTGETHCLSLEEGEEEELDQGKLYVENGKLVYDPGEGNKVDVLGVDADTLGSLIERDQKEARLGGEYDEAESEKYSIQVDVDYPFPGK